jgi:hypothetical protein
MTVGYWDTRSAKLIPEGKYALKGLPGRAYSVMIDGKIVGTIRRYAPHGWMVSIPGYTFYAVPGEGAARIGKKDTNVKMFKTALTARAAIKEAFEQLVDARCA